MQVSEDPEISQRRTRMIARLRESYERGRSLVIAECGTGTAAEAHAMAALVDRAVAMVRREIDRSDRQLPAARTGAVEYRLALRACAAQLMGLREEWTELFRRKLGWRE